MAVAWESVRARLVASLPAAVGSSVTVYDGPTVAGDSVSSYLTVGDQPSSDSPSAGTFTQEVGPDGFSVSETGTVLCELGAVTGATEIPSVFATFDAVAAFIQSDQTLGGVLSPGSTVTASAEIVQAQTTSGAVQRLLLSVNYFARL